MPRPFKSELFPPLRDRPLRITAVRSAPCFIWRPQGGLGLSGLSDPLDKTVNPKRFGLGGMPPIFGLWCFEVFSYRLRELWRFLMADQQIDNSFRNQDTPVSKDIPIKKRQIQKNCRCPSNFSCVFDQLILTDKSDIPNLREKTKHKATKEEAALSGLPGRPVSLTLRIAGKTTTSHKSPRDLIPL